MRVALAPFPKRLREFGKCHHGDFTFRTLDPGQERWSRGQQVRVELRLAIERSRKDAPEPRNPHSCITLESMHSFISGFREAEKELGILMRSSWFAESENIPKGNLYFVKFSSFIQIQYEEFESQHSTIYFRSYWARKRHLMCLKASKL